MAEIPRDDWDNIWEAIALEFLVERDWERVSFEGGFALQQDEQPHWPTHQDYRTATTWFFWAYEQIKTQTESRDHAACVTAQRE